MPQRNVAVSSPPPIPLLPQGGKLVAAEVREKLGARAAGGNARTLLDQSGKCFFGIDHSRDITEVLQSLASPRA